MLNRKLPLLIFAALFIVGGPTLGHAQVNHRRVRRHIVTYAERGDPDAKPEYIVVDLDKLRRTNARRLRQAPGPAKNGAVVMARMVDIAVAFAHAEPPVSRRDTAEKIREFISLYDHYTDINLRYCAMGVAYSVARGYVESPPDAREVPANSVTQTLKRVLPDVVGQYFTPNPTCEIMRQDAIERGHRTPDAAGIWVPKSVNGEIITPQRGWLVLFDWIGCIKSRNKRCVERGRDGRADHIGIVLSYDDARRELTTVEFNTSRKVSGNQSDGGVVVVKGEGLNQPRVLADVLGYIRTY